METYDSWAYGRQRGGPTELVNKRSMETIAVCSDGDDAQKHQKLSSSFVATPDFLAEVAIIMNLLCWNCRGMTNPW